MEKQACCGGCLLTRQIWRGKVRKDRRGFIVSYEHFYTYMEASHEAAWLTEREREIKKERETERDTERGSIREKSANWESIICEFLLFYECVLLPFGLWGDPTKRTTPSIPEDHYPALASLSLGPSGLISPSVLELWSLSSAVWVAAFPQGTVTQHLPF